MEAVEQRLKPYLSALKTLMDPTLFPRWLSATVVKCFSWADAIHELTVQLDGIQTATAAASIAVLGIAFIDDDPSMVLKQPHETLLRAILCSPLLPMSTESAVLVRCAYTESARRLGAATVHAIFQSEYARILEDKGLAGNVLKEWSALVDANDGGSDGDDDGAASERVRPDEVYLSAQLVLACARTLAGRDGDVDIDAAVAAKVQQSIEADATRSSLRMLCLALSLSPAAVYCAADDADADASHDTPVALDAIARVLRSQQLWAILEHIAQTDIAAFYCIEDVFAVFEKLSTKSPRFALAAKLALAAGSSTVT